MIRTTLKFVTIAFAISLSAASWAEDEYYQNVGQTANSNTQYNQYTGGQKAASVDKQYIMPQSYNGKYYPAEEQGVINYYGTSKTSAAEPKDAPYYYYYY
jgi:hypothetical protein